VDQEEITDTVEREDRSWIRQDEALPVDLGTKGRITESLQRKTEKHEAARECARHGNDSTPQSTMNAAIDVIPRGIGPLNASRQRHSANCIRIQPTMSRLQVWAFIQLRPRLLLPDPPSGHIDFGEWPLIGWTQDAQDLITKLTHEDRILCLAKRLAESAKPIIHRALPGENDRKDQCHRPAREASDSGQRHPGRRRNADSERGDIRENPELCCICR